MVNLPLVGDFPPGRVQCSWVPTTFNPTPEVERLIERTWRDVLQASPGVNLFDGPMCRLERFSVDDGVLRLVLSPASYKQFLGTNMHNASLADRLGPGALANPLGVSSALVASEGVLLLGRRNDRVAYYPSRVHPFAGCLEPADDLDVFAEIRRELREELAFVPEDVADLRCLGLAEDPALRQPELIFLVRSTRSRNEIETRLDATEHHATFAVPPDPASAADALREPLLTPVARATLLLWGRTVFSAEWFEKHAGSVRR